MYFYRKYIHRRRLKNLFPPSDEGGGTRFARDRGREKLDTLSFSTTPQPRFVRQSLTAASPSVALRYLPTLWGTTPNKRSKIYFFDMICTAVF